MAYLQLANIKKEYNISRTETQKVLRDISVEFKQGELVALLGESGSGKMIDLMEALTKSLELTQKSKPAKRATTKKTVERKKA